MAIFPTGQGRDGCTWLEVVVRRGQTVLAPAGVKHGFVNRSGKPVRIMAIFPTGKVERVLVE